MDPTFSEKFASATMVINAECHIWICRELLPGMLKRNNGKGDGHIVSVASLAGISGMSAHADYCASKFAAYGLQESIRIEMK